MGMVKSKQCPKCKKQAFESPWKIPRHAASIKCDCCGADLRPTLWGGILFLVPLLASFLMIVSDLNSLVIIAVQGILIFLSFVCLYYFVPLVEIIEKKPGPIFWYTSPVLWIGIPVIIVTLYGIF